MGAGLSVVADEDALGMLIREATAEPDTTAGVDDDEEPEAVLVEATGGTTPAGPPPDFFPPDFLDVVPDEPATEGARVV